MAIVKQIGTGVSMTLGFMASKQTYLSVEKISESEDAGVGAEDCPDILPVFVDPTNPSVEIRNDKFDVMSSKGGFLAGAVTFELHKDGVKVADLNDNTYGTFYPVGSWPVADGFTSNQANQAGYQGNWIDVYNAHGLGCYTIVAQRVTPFGNFSFPSCCYEMNLWTEAGADETVTIKAVQNGKIIKENIDFTGINWNQHYRVPGFFGFPNRNFTETNFITKNRKVEQIQDEIVNDYTLELYFVPTCLKDDIDGILLANDIIISDFNVENACLIRNKSVKWKGEEEVEYFGKSKKIALTLTFEERTRKTIKRNVR